MEPAVTVCVPSYRSAAFIGQTLGSVRSQAFTDFKVLLALEPDGAAETIAAARAFRHEMRIDSYVNDRTLGYAHNVRSVLRRVNTPYFVVLPHDDMWHPDYLATTYAQMEGRPDASGAYTEWFMFGAAHRFRSFAVRDATLAERLLSFFLGGADGAPWRGLTRSSALDSPYPVNEYDGFACECEWALHLLKRGPLLHVAQPLYLKRQAPDVDDQSVSVRWRFRLPDATLRDALAHHRNRMLE